MKMPPAFLITVDTEGDDLWSSPRSVTTRNARFLSRFQALCEKHSLRPTYLTNWEMVKCPEFQSFGRDLLHRKAGEIGMHLHAWNSPPLVSLPGNEHDQIYAFEYPEPLLREKIHVLTQTLEETFGVKMVSHRAGRWGFNDVYARALVENDYQVDCSVTPHVSWKKHLGKRDGLGGMDFAEFPDSSYFLDLYDIRRPGKSSLLEVPMTISAPQYSRLSHAMRSLLMSVPLGRRLASKLFPVVLWLRPQRTTLKNLLAILACARVMEWDYVEFMIHSSELMPGGSPYYPTAESIESLYAELERLFAEACPHFDGLTLAEYYHRYCNVHPPFGEPATNDCSSDRQR